MSGAKRFLVFFVFLFFFGAKNVLATCTVSVTPNNVVMGVSSVSHFSVSNTGDQLGNWVRIESPDLTAYSIAQSDSEGWYGSGGGTRAEFAGGYLESGATGVFDLTLAETGEAISSMNWEALVSYDAGENFESCGIATIQVVPAPVAPQISGVNLTVGNSSATLTWTTNLTASGAVNYGITSGYGSSVVTASGTTHTAGITGLSASTEYHYQIQVTSEGGTTSSTDATFTTSAASVTTTTTTTVTNTVTTTNTNTVTKIITDTTPPTLNIDKLEKRINETAPVLTGTAIDDRGVASVEYQVVGKDTAWITASLNEKVGSKKVTWEALPSLSLDGTYKLKFRAVDVFGNAGVPKEVEFVIDQLPPTVGGGVLSVGALTISENGAGVIEVIENVEYELVLFENGGADKLTLEVDDQKIEMKKVGSGLWRGLIKFKTGEWAIKVSATDGAENTTARDWAKIKVLKRGSLTKNGQAVKEGKIKVMWLDPTFRRYSQWEAGDYGQASEKELKEDGVVSWILPRGEYYLEALVDGRAVVSQKIILDKTTNISGDWEMLKNSRTQERKNKRKIKVKLP